MPLRNGNYDCYTISEFKQHIPDLEDFIDFMREVFLAGGFLAGGSLLRAIQSGGILRLFDANIRIKTDEWGGEAFRSDSLSPNCICDADFFFSDEKEYFDFLKKNVSYVDNNTLSYTPLSNRVGETPVRKFHCAYMNFSNCDYAGDLFVRANLIYLGDERKRANEILDSFDFTNCKIGTDGANIYIHKDVLDLERRKTLQINALGTNVRTKGQINIIKKTFFRVKKYLSRAYYESFEDPNKVFFNEINKLLLDCHYDSKEAKAQLLLALNNVLSFHKPTFLLYRTPEENETSFSIISDTELVMLCRYNGERLVNLFDRRSRETIHPIIYKARDLKELTRLGILAKVKKVEKRI